MCARVRMCSRVCGAVRCDAMRCGAARRGACACDVTLVKAADVTHKKRQILLRTARARGQGKGVRTRLGRDLEAVGQLQHFLVEVRSCMLLRRAARANEHSESTGMHNAAKRAGLRYFAHSMQTHNKPNDKDRPRAPAQARAFGRVQRVDAAALGEAAIDLPRTTKLPPAT